MDEIKRYSIVYIMKPFLASLPPPQKIKKKSTQVCGWYYPQNFCLIMNFSGGSGLVSFN